MADERRDFGEYYPGGGTQTVSPPTQNFGGRVTALEGRIEAVKAAAAELPDMDPDGEEALADVKEKVNAVKDALADM